MKYKSRPTGANTIYRPLKLSAAILGGVMLVAACGSSSPKSSQGSTGSAGSSSSLAPYTLTFVADLTGGNALDGQPALAAVQGAVWQINHSGGVNGHMLQIKQVGDSQSTAAGAETAVRSAVSNPVTFTSNALGGNELSGTAPIYSAAGIPSVSVAYPIAQLINQPWWFTLSPTGQQVAAGAVNGLKSLLGGSLTGKTIGFEGLNVPTVDNNLAAIKALVEQDGGHMGPIIRDPLTFTSWSSQAANVAAAHVDGFIVNHDEAMTAVVAKALVVAGIKVPIVSTEGASSDTLFKTVGASNFYAVRETSESAVGSGSVPAKAAQAAGYGAASTQNPYFAREWGAVYAAAGALHSCGSPCSASKFEQALTSMGSYTVPYEVFLGPVQFSSSQHAGLTTAQIYAWNAGQGAAVPSGQPFSINS